MAVAPRSSRAECSRRNLSGAGGYCRVTPPPRPRVGAHVLRRHEESCPARFARPLVRGAAAEPCRLAGRPRVVGAPRQRPGAARGGDAVHRRRDPRGPPPRAARRAARRPLHRRADADPAGAPPRGRRGDHPGARARPRAHRRRAGARGPVEPVRGRGHRPGRGDRPGAVRRPTRGSATMRRSSTGAWAEPGADPVEVAVSEAAAGVLGVATGDTLPLVGRLDGRPVDGGRDGDLARGPRRPLLAGRAARAGRDRDGRLVHARGAAWSWTGGPRGAAGRRRPVDAQWRAIPDLAGFRPETLDVVATEVTGLLGEINAALPGVQPGHGRDEAAPDPRLGRPVRPRRAGRASCCCWSSSGCSPGTPSSWSPPCSSTGGGRRRRSCGRAARGSATSSAMALSRPC